MIASRLLRLVNFRLKSSQLTRISTVGYRTKGDHGLGSDDDKFELRSRAGRNQFIKRTEEMADEFTNIDNPESFGTLYCDHESQQRRVKYKIMEKKYFRPPQEINLLTWDAKEQLRYLHQEFPEEWTIDRLSESFPISRDGVIRILKSKWTPKTLREIVNHDKRVQQIWITLVDSEANDDTQQLPEGPRPVESRYQKLLEGGRLSHAAGIKTLPSPKPNYLLSDHEASRLPHLPLAGDTGQVLKRNRSKGNPPKRALFESIVKYYCEKKEALMIEDGKKEVSRIYEWHRTDIQHSLQKVVVGTAIMLNLSKSDVTEVVPRMTRGAHRRKQELTVEGDQGMDDLNKQGGGKARTLFDVMRNKDAKQQFSEQADAILRGHPEIPHDFIETTIEDDSRAIIANRKVELEDRKSLRARGDASHVKSTLDRGIEILQMEGTGRVRATKESDKTHLNDYITDNEFDQIRPEKYHVNDNKSRFLSRVRYDTPQRGEAEQEEAYIYSKHFGYQYPFGKTDQSLKVDIPKKYLKNRERKLYQKGNAVYNRNGELLFRVP